MIYYREPGKTYSTYWRIAPSWVTLPWFVLQPTLWKTVATARSRGSGYSWHCSGVRLLCITYTGKFRKGIIIISHTPYHHITYSVSSYTILCIIISHTPYHHVTYSVSSYTILRIIISHTPYHHIPYPILRMIISHTPYDHISYSVSSFPILRIIISHTPYDHCLLYTSPSPRD